MRSRTGASEQQGNLISKYVTVHGQPLHYRVSTNPAPTYDEAIIMVHGLAVSSRYMQPTARLLAPAYHVFTPDLPGSGQSQGSTPIPNLKELADILADWMAALNLRRAHFLGNSVGCQVLLQLALHHPELIQSLILTAPTMDPRARTIFQEVVRWLKNVPYEPPALIGIVLRDFLDIGFRRFFATLCSSLHDPVEQHLPYIQMPTLIVRGTHDTVVSQEWVEEVTRLLPEGHLVVLRGAAHDLTYNSSEELARLARAFVLSQAASSRERPKLPR